MSQFFDQYNAILEKSLQKVRLRVDPNVKYAEDFAQYDGYVGYILAETDDSIDFFYENNTVTLPKNVVFIEGAVSQWLGDKAKAAGQGAGNFIRGAAGQNTGTSVAGALGSMAGSVAKGAANLGSMIYTGQKLFDGNKQQTGNSTAPTQAIDKTKSLAIKNKNGNASITINGMDYGIINIKDANNKSLVTLNNNVLILAHYNAFNLVLNTSWSTLNEAPGFSGLANNTAGIPGAATGTNTAVPAAAPTAPAPTTPAPAANTTATPPASAADAFLQMPSVTVSALNAKKLLGVPLKVSLLPITQPNATKKPVAPIDYSVKFTAAPNNAEILVTFL